jgi:hypothetical protein
VEWEWEWECLRDGKGSEVDEGKKGGGVG